MVKRTSPCFGRRLPERVIYPASYTTRTMRGKGLNCSTMSITEGLTKHLCAVRNDAPWKAWKTSNCKVPDSFPPRLEIQKQDSHSSTATAAGSLVWFSRKHG